MLLTCQKNAMELNNFFNMRHFKTHHLEINSQDGELSLFNLEPHLIYQDLS